MNLIGVGHKTQLDIALLDDGAEEIADISHESHHLSVLTLEAHLVLVDLPFVENLVDKDEQPVGVMVDSADVFLTLLVVGKTGLETVEGSDDERQRRFDVVGGINEEPHFRLLELSSLATRIGVECEHDNSGSYKDVDNDG